MVVDLDMEPVDLKPANIELERASEQLSLSLDNIPVIAYTYKAEDDFAATYVSDSVTSVTGFKPEDFYF